MKAHLWSRRTVYLAAVVAIVASTSGFALASVLSPPTTVTQGTNFYNGANGGVAGYTGPALAYAASPGACTSGTVTDSTTGEVATLVLSAYTGATNCTKNDAAELLTLAYFSASTTTHVDNFTIYSQMGSNPIQTNYVHLQLGTAAPGSFAASVQVFIDYGPVPPMGGISLLELVLHHP